MAFTDLSSEEKAKILRRFIPGVQARLAEKHPELLSLTLGHRERGGEVIENELALKALVTEKQDAPSHPFPRTITVETSAQAATDQTGSPESIVLPIDVISFPDPKLTAAATVRADNSTGCLAGRIRWDNGQRAWLTVSHLLHYPGRSPLNAITTQPGGVALNRIPGSLWLEDPEERGYPLDATVVLETSDMKRFASWTAGRIQAKFWTQHLAGLTGFRFIDQHSQIHSLRYHTTFPAGVLRYPDRRQFPTVHLFQSNTYSPVGGDSGGPVWIEFEGRRNLVGIQSAELKGNFVVIPIHSVSRAFRDAALMSGLHFQPLK